MGDPKRLADHLVQIDEDLATQQIVELVLARRVRAHETLQR
jgi:hypothetical protein